MGRLLGVSRPPVMFSQSPTSSEDTVEELRHRGKEMVDYMCGYLRSVGERRVTPDVRPGYLRVEELRHRGKEMVDYMCGYLRSVGERRVTPDVRPGYLRALLPPAPPDLPEPWDTIMEDVDRHIMQGITHWQHPGFHAYLPSFTSCPSILGDMLSDAMGCLAVSWAASPACTELEMIVLDWLGKAMGLPDDFLAVAPNGRGGGVIQTSASECVLVTMLAARTQAVGRLKKLQPSVEDGVLLSKLVAYCSKEAHSCIKKAAMVCFVKLRSLETDKEYSLRGQTLRQAMEDDLAMGLVPFYVAATLGTTSCCSFDALPEIGPVCRQFPDVWLHVDAAYAGNSFILPEHRHFLAGIEFGDSINTCPSKLLLVNFDLSALWVRDRVKLTSALNVDAVYLQHGHSNTDFDYRHWSIPLSRRFRALKLWFVLRRFGLSGLQAHVRQHYKLGKQFEALVRGDPRFVVCNQVKIGLVCFRLKGTNELNERLLSMINNSGKLHIMPAMVNNRLIIRFSIGTQNTTAKDIDYAWEVITQYATELFSFEMEGKKKTKS